MSVVTMEAQPPPTPAKKIDLNTDYLLTPPGMLRAAEGVLSLAALISIVEGYCGLESSRYGFLLFVVIVSMLESIVILTIFVFRLEDIFKSIDLPLTFLLNDGIALILFFISTIIAFLNIGRCEFLKFARLIGALFVLSIFLVSVGLNYFNYLRWQEKLREKENGKTSTITESSPTVLT